jgi:hypothetical protein
MGMQTIPLPSAAPSQLFYAQHATHGGSCADDNVRLAGVVERLVDTAPSLEALRRHRLHLAAARIWQSRGREVPADFVCDERAAAVRAILARRILGKAQSAIAEALRDTAAREPDENWTTKLRRSRLAIAHAFASRSSHEQSLASIGATGGRGEAT